MCLLPLRLISSISHPIILSSCERGFLVFFSIIHNYIELVLYNLDVVFFLSSIFVIFFCVSEFKNIVRINVRLSTHFSVSHLWVVECERKLFTLCSGIFVELFDMNTFLFVCLFFCVRFVCVELSACAGDNRETGYGAASGNGFKWWWTIYDRL